MVFSLANISQNLVLTETLVLDYAGFCRLVSQSDVIRQNLSYDLEITQKSALEKAQFFFTSKNVLVQAGGIQGVIYKVGSYGQSTGSAALVVNTIALAQLAVITGLQILKAQPLLVIAIPTTGDIIALPMKDIEIMWNSYGNIRVQKVLGEYFQSVFVYNFLQNYFPSNQILHPPSMK